MAMRLENHYNLIIKPDLTYKMAYLNIQEVPRIEKIVLNIRHSNTHKDKLKVVEAATLLEILTGKKPQIIKSKKAVSAFNLKKGIYTAVKLTLRQGDMFNFLDKFIHQALPRIEDFRGVSQSSFDEQGNYNIAIRNILVFNEVEVESNKLRYTHSMNVSIITTAKSVLESKMLLSAFQLPFREN